MVKNLIFQLKYYFLGILFLTAIFIWYAVFAETKNSLDVHFLNVGQGDAIFIQAPNGNKVLIDGGPPNKAVLRELSKIMPFYDGSIDVTILTHNHLDHYGGLNEVLAKYRINLGIDSGTKNSDTGFVEFEKILNKKNITRIYGRKGIKINLGNGAFLDILLPVINNENLSPHDGMLVAKLIYGNNSFLLTGDMEDNLEKYLLDLGSDIKSDVLKIGHHGSKTSTLERFLGNVNPEVAVISVGKNNKYGHPHQEVVERLKQFEVPILRTDENGTIKISSDGEKIFVEKK